jgi:hypothetical protein
MESGRLTLTRAASNLETYLDGQWPLLTFQRFNCRPIAGTSTYSQHAWPGGNARDIFGPTWMLDRVAAHLRDRRVRFGIKTVLWRVKGHYDHVHADMWPTGYGRPPCAGGVERYRYSNGRIVAASGGNVMPEGSFVGEVPVFTVEEVAALKALAPYAETLTVLGRTLLAPGPTTGKVGSGYTLIQLVEVYRLVAQNAGIDPLDHVTMANFLSR